MKGSAGGILFVVAALLVVGVALPLVFWVTGSPFIARLGQLVLLTVVLTIALNLLTGTAGLLALDSVVFLGFGAYTGAILSTRFGTSFPVELLVAVAGTAVIAFLLGLLLVRLHSVFFAVATVGLAVSFYTTVLNWGDLTRGAMGIPAIPPVRIAGYELDGWLATYMLAALMALVAVFVGHRMTHSFYGNAARAIREDEDAARSMGLTPRFIKAQIYAVHGALMAMAGVLYAHVNSFVGPDNFLLLESALILTAIVIGGLGSLPGAVLGAVLVVLAPEMLRQFGDLRAIIFGVILFLAILFLPRGLLSEVRSLAWVRRLDPASPWARRKRRS
ncbi:branched-chain amino acid ABC transporter permease [Microbaculum marinum]|uniref:Branched-chain amino acid ABC transporter permease n=1 Tax=Microbaculum marinum TaxID=1764581 RepID=A0AAW9RNF2_9HYPH